MGSIAYEMEEKKVKINIEIAGTIFPMEPPSNRERHYRIGREQVNALREDYAIQLQNYLRHGIIDPIDVWKLVALQCAANAALETDISAETLTAMDAFTQEVNALLAEADNAEHQHNENRK